jgi:hypothetical protein
MTRLILAVIASALVAGPSFAAIYSAKPVVPASQPRIIGRDIVWSCGPAACQGATDESRPLVLCQGLAKRAGRLESFTINGSPFGTADLARCNASAPAGGSSSLAKAD